MCIYINKEISADTDNMNVLQFYNAIDYIKKTKQRHGKSN